MDQRPRLTPTMSSSKAMVFDFITAFIGEHSGTGPSLGEIMYGCGLPNRQAAHKLVTALVVEGRVRRLSGRTRGLSLPSAIDEAKRLLRLEGFIVDEDVHRIGGRSLPLPLTFQTLPMLPIEAQIAGGDIGDGDGGDLAGQSGDAGTARDRSAVPAAGTSRAAGGAGGIARGAEAGTVDGPVEQPGDEGRPAARRGGRGGTRRPHRARDRRGSPPAGDGGEPGEPLGA